MILVGALVVVIVTIVLFTPMLGRQISGFVLALPDLVKKAQGLVTSVGDQITHGWISKLLAKVGINDSSLATIKDSASDYVNKAVSWIAAFLNGVLTRGAALLDLLSLIVITPVVAFYMLLDWRRLVATIDGLVPPRDRETVRGIAHDIDQALAGFLRGQSLVCLFLAAWYGIGLSVIGLNFGLLIGIAGGFLSFVPYVGSLLVLALSLLVAVVQGWPNWHLPVFALVVVLIGQFLEGNVLSPKLVGDKVGLHPVLAYLRAACVRQRLGIYGPHRRRPRRLGSWGSLEVRHEALSREPDLHGRGESGSARAGHYSRAAGFAAVAAGAPAARLMIAPPDRSEPIEPSRQLILDLGRDPSFDPDDFLASPSNAEACAMLDRWPDWSDRTMLLVGPPGCGKSHLAAVWAMRTGARVVRPGERLEPGTWAAPVIALVEDCDRAGHDEAALFHLVNLVREGGGWLLITAREVPALWNVRTPDLLSRLRLSPLVPHRTT